MRRSLAFGVALLGSLYGLPADGADKGDASKAGPVYDKWCSQCHGATGGGDGPGAAFMMPRPRVFTDNPMYKFRVTASESIFFG